MPKELREYVNALAKHPTIPEKVRARLESLTKFNTNYLTLFVALDDLELDLLTSTQGLESQIALALVGRVKKEVCDEGVIAYTNSVGHHLIHSLGVLPQFGGGNPFDRTNHLEEAQNNLEKARRLASYYPQDRKYEEYILYQAKSLDRFQRGIREALARQNQ